MPEKNSDEEAEKKHPKLWGGAYMVLGLLGISFSVWTLIRALGLVPLYGEVTAGVLVGLISLMVLAYGYRVFRRDY